MGPLLFSLVTTPEPEVGLIGGVGAFRLALFWSTLSMYASAIEYGAIEIIFSYVWEGQELVGDVYDDDDDDDDDDVYGQNYC